MNQSAVSSLGQSYELRSPGITQLTEMVAFKSEKRHIGKRIIEMCNFIPNFDIFLQIGVDRCVELEIVACEDRVEVDYVGFVGHQRQNFEEICCPAVRKIDC